MPCNVSGSTESGVTFIMYSPQGKSSRLEDHGSGLKQELQKKSCTCTACSRGSRHPFSPCVRGSLLLPFLLHPLSSSLVFIFTSPPVPFILSSTLPPPPPALLVSLSPPTPTLLLWFLFPDRPETERDPPPPRRTRSMAVIGESGEEITRLCSPPADFLFLKAFHSSLSS